MSERRLEYVRLDAIVPDARNPKSHDLGTLRASLGRFAYTEPVLMDERTGQLVAGHGRCDALMLDMLEGGPPPEGVGVDGDGMWTVPVVRGWASADDAEAGAYLVASNRLSEIGGWSDQALVDLLNATAASAAGLDGIGYSDDDLADLIAALTVPPFEPLGPDAQAQLDHRTPITCPSCGAMFTLK